MRALRDMADALGVMTVLPVGREDAPSRDSVGYYPLVGWLLGADAAIVVWLLRSLGSSSTLLAAALVVAYWTAVTGGLHLDGLADTFDGLGAGPDPERRRAAMKDSRLGATGTTALVVVVAVTLAAVAALLGKGLVWPLVAAPVLARFCASVFLWTVPPAHREGLGGLVAGRPSPYALALGIGSVALLAALPLLAQVARSAGVQALPVRGSLASDTRLLAVILVTAGATAVALPAWLRKVLGGVSGDLLGACIVLAETTVLTVAAVVR